MLQSEELVLSLDDAAEKKETSPLSLQMALSQRSTYEEKKARKGVPLGYILLLYVITEIPKAIYTVFCCCSTYIVITKLIKKNGQNKHQNKTFIIPFAGFILFSFTKKH